MRELAYKINIPEKKSFDIVHTLEEARKAKNAGWEVKEILIDVPEDVRIRIPAYNVVNGHLELNATELAGGFA